MSAEIKSIRTVALCRRLLLALAALLLFLVAAIPLARAFSRAGWTSFRAGFFALFVVLFSQVVFSFVVSAAGWWVLWTRRRMIQITQSETPVSPPATPPATAIIMPIHNEDVERVFQGLRAMYLSLRKQSASEAFDFFVLSDTTDANSWIAEENAWLALCKEVDGFGRIFYRKRRVQLHNKSGNIADFCRRWGATYRYMIVLDADSMMTGASFVRLAGLMEQNPNAGIIQTTTFPIFGQTLFQRLEQFAACVYRPVIASGLNFWQLRDASFWGHNAIIRVKPFMEFCAMPDLPEVGPLGKRILSHDTIEAALMRRGGYEVWQAVDLKGSYEEGPPHLAASLQRDQRWCHGNMQHIWFLFERGLKTVSRFNILNGILAYANAPLWLASVLMGLFLPFHDAAAKPHSGALNPIFISAALYGYTLFLLIAPKFLAASIVIRSPEKTRLCGGRAKVLAGVVFETIYSMLLGSILMLFFTKFVLGSFSGAKVRWGRQMRTADEEPPWSLWFSMHWLNTLLALTGLVLMIAYDREMLPWFLPVLIGPLLALPLSRLTASTSLGQAARSKGWLLTPEETEPPADLEMSGAPLTTPPHPFFLAREYAPDYGLLQAVLDPYVNAIHVSMLRERKEAGVRTRDYMSLLADKLLLDGPFELTPVEKRTLLWDADAMLSMHQKLWSSPPSHLHEWWQAAFRHYVETSALTVRRSVTA